MVAPANVLGLCYCALFAASGGGGRDGPSTTGRQTRPQSSGGNAVGRSRYAGGRRKRPAGRGGGGGDATNSRSARRRRPPSSSSSPPSIHAKAAAAPLLPSPTTPNSPRPSYYTCRHTYEDALAEEVRRQVATRAVGGNKEAIEDNDEDDLTVSSPHPGLICVSHPRHDVVGTDDLLPPDFHPTYALQSLQNCIVVQAESIKGLANAALDASFNEGDERTALLKERLWSAPRGSLSIHALVPDMFRGVPDPPLKRRAYKIAEEVASQLKKICPAARPIRDGDEDGGEVGDNDDKWVMQILLLAPEVAAASLVKCCQSSGMTTWPNWSLPGGLAKVDIDQPMPSSAYRKLLESFWFLGDRPPSATSPSSNGPILRQPPPPVVDLGACPGGWTGALRLMGCRTISIDRSPLDESLMNDPLVTFVEGDAFRFVSPWIIDDDDGDDDSHPSESPLRDTWMVSDVIAYPERVSEILDRWCGRKWASHIVHTVKFQGKEIPWEELKKAEEVARKHGYACMTKHFFNNKNEVTLMAVHANNAVAGRDEESRGRIAEQPLLGEAMYPPVLLGGKKVGSSKK